MNILSKIRSLFGGEGERKFTHKIIASILLVIIGGAIIFYVFLPALNFMSKGFWIYLTVLAVLGSIPFMDSSIVREFSRQKSDGAHIVFAPKIKPNKWIIAVICTPIAILLVGMLISSPIFNARSYAAIIEVHNGDFSEDLPETTEVTNIALMDTESAMMLGNRTLGSLSHVVSQYTVGTTYTQINYKNTPKKVTNLEYDGFFKWLGNRDNGIPGMVIVDPVNSGAEYHEFKAPMHYVESAFFGEDLLRKLRFAYPTKIFDYESVSFEIDDEGNPYYIVSCYRPRVALFGASDVSEVIIFDPTDASSEIYSIEDTPSWIDIVYDGYLATEKYNWYGIYSGGYINSIIGNVGCKMATDDFGYIVIDDDVWYFTGVTSAVSNDKSNIGFILTNARTGEYKFYPVIGAEEHSAMAAAEGEVQEKGYVASFPSLINVSGQPTYIMVLKDVAGLVKLYALVNVENYSIVETGQTQADAMSSYKKALRQSDIEIGDPESSIEFSVTRIVFAMVSDVATVYISADNGNVYKGYLEADEELILINEGDKLKVNYASGDAERVYIISSWEFVDDE